MVVVCSYSFFRFSRHYALLLRFIVHLTYTMHWAVVPPTTTPSASMPACILGWVVGFGICTLSRPPTAQSLANQGALTLLHLSPLVPDPWGGEVWGPLDPTPDQTTVMLAICQQRSSPVGREDWEGHSNWQELAYGTRPNTLHMRRRPMNLSPPKSLPLLAH